MPGFDLEKLRLQSIVTPILSARRCNLWCLQSRVHNKKKQQPQCSQVYFILKTNYVKLHLCIEGSTTLFDNIITSLMILLLDLFAYAALCCPYHYSTGTIPVPFADREGDQGTPVA